MTLIDHFSPLTTGDLLSITDLSREDVETLLATALSFKQPQGYRPFHGLMTGRSLVMMFEKPSLRTRMSFEIGFAKLGGHPVYFDHQSAGGRIGQRETIEDVAKNLNRFCDVIVARTFSHETIEALAEHARVPVINALCDKFHPCQALADALTIAEQFPGRTWNELSLAYVGDGNNVCHSLMHICALLGVRMTVIMPKGFEPARDIVQQATAQALSSGTSLHVTNDVAAIAQHDVVYTDTWVSMGAESEAEQRLKAFAGYQITPRLMQSAGRDARFMHCLPAYRGKEVAAEVIDGPNSVVFDQAENRMHAQNALLIHLLAGDNAHRGAPTWPDVIGASV